MLIPCVLNIIGIVDHYLHDLSYNVSSDLMYDLHFLICCFMQEPLGGAHADPYYTSQQIKTAIVESMDVSCIFQFHYSDSSSASLHHKVTRTHTWVL